MATDRDFKIIRTIEKLNHIIHRSRLTTNFVSLFYGELEPRTEAHDVGRVSATQELPATSPVVPVVGDDDPFASVPRRADSGDDVIRGLTSTHISRMLSHVLT